jgi:hypothetical protein
VERFEEYAKLKEDAYGNVGVSKLVQLMSEDELIRKCNELGIDKIEYVEYTEGERGEKSV